MPAFHPGQLLLVGVPGTELDSDTARTFRKLQPGGFILFGRNIQTPTQLRKLLDDLRDLSDEEPILTIDQEGGRVSRLRLLGNEPPNAQQLSQKGDPSLIRRHGEITANLLLLFGFNLDLCPVLDLNLEDDADNSLRGRCYGRSVPEVIANAGCFNDSLRASGILSCGKHFPGYTHAGQDPHHELPELVRSREDMESCELAVFRAFTQSVDSMMIGHISAPGLDPKPGPASLSQQIIGNLLREEMGFRGLVMTDDLDMGAILNFCGFDEAMRRALLAGNDLLMLCHRVEMATRAVDAISSLPTNTLERAAEAVRSLREKFSPPSHFSESRFQELDEQVWQLRVDTLGEEEARRRSPEDGKRSPVELY